MTAETTQRTVPEPRARVRDGEGEAEPPTAESPAGAVLMAYVGRQIAQVQAQETPVRLDVPDSIHKMRVATRRLRSALTTFAPLVDADVARPLRTQLKWLAGTLGAARDAEVMRDRLRAAMVEEGHLLHTLAGVEDVMPELSRAYRDAHERVLAALGKKRYHRLLTTLRSLADDPPLLPPAAAPAGTVLPPLVGHGYRRVRQLVEEARALPPGSQRDELLHDGRKAAKIARYAGEAVAPVFGRPAATFAAAMEELQEVLGEHHDSVVTRERLRDLAFGASSTEAAFLCGRLHAREEARSQSWEQHFDAAWESAGRESLTEWLRAVAAP